VNTNYEPFLRAGQVAALLGISKSQARHLMASGEIPAVRLDRYWRASRAAIEQWVAEAVSRQRHIVPADLVRASGTTPRGTIPARLRFAILARDNFTCRYCGRMAPAVALTVDHVVSVADGGTDDEGNLVAACDECNMGKGAMTASLTAITDITERNGPDSTGYSHAQPDAMADVAG